MTSPTTNPRTSTVCLVEFRLGETISGVSHDYDRGPVLPCRPAEKHLLHYKVSGSSTADV